ncbi:MAG: ATP-dependent DNA helicase RecQ, partial [Epulopiscium sp.]|nr:ATP-dependent DNA helicase RecQ [Candidatus Epulonipiscium sp.]
DKMDSKKALKRYFDYDSFRNFNGVPLQEEATNSALKGNSLLAIFPTGGGKSLAFQLPALINKETTNALTVVISPLQSLMKDQVDNLEAKNITSAVTINGLLDPIQRADAIKRVIDGSAGILYISPEFLRSKTLERILNERQIARFVIDEAHCFSTWGQDFRVDYLYIAEFIKKIEKNNKNKQIPISCFTATAKKDVIEDITDYFKERLNLDLVIFQAKGRRENLEYQVHLTEESDDKYRRLRDIILQENCPTIIYSSRTKTVDDVYQRLYLDKFSVAKFHGKMETEHKIEEQNKFKNGEAMIMVATSAFGMGVDKDDVGCVIHYDISDSLENYVQESGRAGRSDKIEAKCYILFNENDLNKHFELLNSSKLNIDEIKSVWRAIKNLTKLRNSVSLSALEIAKAAGWNEEVYGLETKIMTAVSALEEAGYLKRGQNSPRVFANSILSKTLIDAKKMMEDSKLFNKEDFDSATRILSLLISSKRRSMAGNELAESRVDYIASILGLTRTTTIRIINLLRECKVLAD